MKVKILIKRFCPDEVIGGAEAFAGRIAGGLAALGHQVQITSARYKSSWKKKDVLAGVTSGSHSQIPVIRLPHPASRFVGTVVFNLSLLWSLIRERHSYDVVFVCFASFEAATAALASLFTAKPVVCKIAASGPNGDIGLLSRRWYSPVANALIRRINCFIGLNREVIEDLLRLGVKRSKIAHIPNGIDTVRFKPVSPERKALAKQKIGVDPAGRLIVSVGRLTRQKSFETLIRALAGLSDRQDWQTFILGQGSEHDFLTAEIKKYGLEQRVIITLESNDIRRYLSAADIFVLPSRWEGVSNALLEAMSSGLACIASDIPGSNEVINHGSNGLLFETDNHGALAETIEQLLMNPIETKALGLYARRSIRDAYALENIVHRYEALFETVRDGRPVEDGPSPEITIPSSGPESWNQPEKSNETEHVHL